MTIQRDVLKWMFACNKKCHQKVIRVHLLDVAGRLLRRISGMRRGRKGYVVVIY